MRAYVLERSGIYASGFSKLGGIVVDDPASADLIHIGPDAGLSPEEVEGLIRSARSNGAVVSIAPGPSIDPERLGKAILPLADRLHLDEEGARVLSGIDDPVESARRIEGRMAPGSLLTLRLGSGGFVVLKDRTLIELSPLPYFNVKDRIGYGETFSCAIDYLLSTGRGLKEAAILAAGDARATLERPGGKEGQLDEEGIKALLRNYDLIEEEREGVLRLRFELPQVKALFLDMDGLMALTEDIHMEAFEELMRRKGFEGFKLSPEEQAYFVGRDTLEDCRYLKERYGLEGDLEEIFEERQRIYFELVRRRGVPPNDGLEEIFETAKRKGIKMIVTTNSPDYDVKVILESMFRTMGMEVSPWEFFDGFSTVSKVERSKPEPDVYLLAIDMAGVDPRHCVVLEDSESGVLSARRAGIMRVLAVPHRYTMGQDFSEAFAVLSGLREALKFI